MEDTLIQYDTAKLAKEKKFWIENTQNFRSKIGTMYLGITSSQSLEDIKRIYFEESEEYVILVRQSILQKWLREVHNLNINIKHRAHSQTFCFNITGNYQDGESGELYSQLYSKYETYEQCLEQAIIEALKLIK